MVKTLTTQLQNLFATGQCQWFDLFQFSLVGGSTYYYSGGDADIYLNTSYSGGDSFWNNQYFSAGGNVGPFFNRKDNKAKMHAGIGLQVDTFTFDVIPGTSTINGAPFLTACREGVFDAAQLIYLGAYFPLAGGYSNPIIPTGVVKKYVGRVANIDASRNLASFTINSQLELLNQNLPLNLYQTTCNNTLYDASCTLAASNYTTSATVSTGSTMNTVYSTLSKAQGYFNLGVLTFTSGVNNGVSRTIKNYLPGSPGSLTLVSPLPSAPSAGDTCTIVPGCSKTLLTCATKFNNLSNYRGFPFVPQVETAS